jgi:hypothetical protein
LDVYVEYPSVHAKLKAAAQAHRDAAIQHRLESEGYYAGSGRTRKLERTGAPDFIHDGSTQYDTDIFDASTDQAGYEARTMLRGMKPLRNELVSNESALLLSAGGAISGLVSNRQEADHSSPELLPPKVIGVRHQEPSIRQLTANHHVTRNQEQQQGLPSGLAPNGLPVWWEWSEMQGQGFDEAMLVSPATDWSRNGEK